MSSRKYDWNVAPKDLEKIRRAHGACVVFFLKKIKVYLLQLLLLKRIKSIFQLVFYFIFFLALTIIKTQSNQHFVLLYLERCQEKFYKNIPSLLAGKSEQICTAFPLTTFSRQKFSRFDFNTTCRAKVFKWNFARKILFAQI